jgi:hypothetical protein
MTPKNLLKKKIIPDPKKAILTLKKPAKSDSFLHLKKTVKES